MNNRTRSILVSVIVILLCFTQALATDVFSPAVSVTYTGSSIADGTIVSKPVSVTYAGSNIVDGTIVSEPVSVTYTGSSIVDGTIVSEPVSVSYIGSESSDGAIVSPPVSVVANQFLGLWSMENTWLDTSGNGNNATPNGSVSFNAAGKSGSAGSFSGAGYVDAGSSTTLRPNYAVSIEAWIKINQGSVGNMYIAGNTDETSMTGYGLILNGDGTVQMKVGKGSLGIVNSHASLTQGIWYHVAGIYDGSKIKIYINGVEDNEASASGIITYTNSFRIGYRPGNSGAGYYSGLIDELAVFNRPLAASEVARHYIAGKIDITPPAPPTVNSVTTPTASATLTLSGTKDADSSIWANNTQIVQLDGTTTWQGTYALNPGTNTLNITSVDSSDNQSSPVTLSVVLDNQPPIIESSTPANNLETIQQINNVSINLVDTYSTVNLSGSVANATVKNAAGQSIPGTWTTSGLKTVIFTPSSPFPGDKYTVTIYPVDSLGNSGTQQIVFTNHDVTPPVTAIALSGTLGSDGWYSTSVAVTLTASDGPDSSGVNRTEYSLDNVAWNAYEAPFVLTKDGVNIIYYRSIDNSGNVETTKSQAVKINQSGVVGQWHMENDWTDSSVVGNNGTAYNGAAFSTDAKAGYYSGSFDGINDYVQITDDGTLRPATALTIEAWIKLTSAPSTNVMIFDHETGSPFYGYALSISSDKKLNVDLYTGAASTLVGNTVLQLNTWYHVVTTYDGSNIKVYVNGVADGSLLKTGAINYTTSANPTIGKRSGGSSNYFPGLLDELTIYNRALSAAELMSGYQAASVPEPMVDPVTSPTASQTISISGSKPVNTSILINGTEIVANDNSTSWQSTYNLQVGLNSLNITAMNLNGYQSDAVTVTVIVDDTAPSVTGTTPANNSYINMLQSSIVFNLSDTYAIDGAATVNGATVKNSAGQDIPGAWTASGNAIIFTPTASFTDDTYTLTIYPTDVLGNKKTAQLVFIYDTTAPPAPTINAVTSPTNQSSQTITGIKTADTVAVIVSSSTATIGEVSYPTSTTWSVNISNVLHGSNIITAYAKDAAGNQSDVGSAVVIFDITAPATPTVNAVSSTNKTSVPISVTKEVNSYLYVNNLITTAPFADTSWSYTASLSEGNNTFTFYAKDAAGNQSSSSSVNIVRDTTAPRILISTPAANAYTNQAGTIDIVLTDDNSTVDMSSSLNGAVVRNSSGAAINGSWSAQGNHIIFTPNQALSDEVYTVTIQPVDSLGNIGAASFSFTLDAIPPVVQSFTMTPDSPLKAEAVVFTVVFSEAMNSSIQPIITFGRTSPYTDISASSGTWQSDAKTWKTTVQLTQATGDGNYVVRIANGWDKAGNSVVPKNIGTFVLETVPPAAPTLNTDNIITPTKTPNQALSGTKGTATAIFINGIQRVPLNTAATWSYTYPLLEGTNTLTITARDASGNESLPVTSSITLDTTPPSFTVNFKTPWSALTQSISGTKEPGCVMKINGTTIFDATDQSSQWTYQLSLTSGITNVFVFTAADALGNTTSKTIDIICDISAPPALGPGVLTADGSGKGMEATLSWFPYVEIPDMAYYKVFVSPLNFSDTTGMQSVGTTTKGIKTYKVSSLTKGSTYYFAVVPVDQSGNFVTAVNTASAIPTDTVAPEDVTITAVTAGYDMTGNYITLNWKPSIDSVGDLAGGVVYLDDGKGYDAGTPLAKTATGYTKSGLIDATQYKFKITVKDTTGNESTGVITTGMTRLANPSGLTASPGNAKAALLWTPVSSTYVKQYNIYRTVSDAPKTDIGSMTLIKTVPLSTSTYIDTGLANGTTYQYAVTTVNTNGAERTDIASVGAKARADETGPAITAFNITTGQIITAPMTLTASATDSESNMDRMEFYIDGSLVQTQGGLTQSSGSISYLYNVVNTTDGNHAIKLIAYDQYGNATSDTRQIVVSLAPPASPVITGRTVLQTTPKYLISVTGTAPVSTTVSLKVNGSVVMSSPSANGIFSFSPVALNDGDNILAAKASHRGGDSPYSADYKVTVDTGAPPPPVNLTAQVLSAGVVRLTWQSGTGEIPTGYNLYISGSTFTDKGASGVTKANTSTLTYLLNDFTPTDDGMKYYAVTALDSSGNESGLSNIVTASSDRIAPSISSLTYNYYDQSGVEVTGDGGAQIQTAGIGSVKVTLAVSEALTDLPFFSLQPQQGSPIVVAMNKIDNTHYSGSFTVTAQSPSGPTTYKFSGKDLAGNRGNVQGAGIGIDVTGPVASILAPVTVLQITASATVNIVFNEPSVTVPVMELKASNGSASISSIVSTDNGIHWSGTLDAASLSSLAEGQAQFILDAATDKLGNVGTTVYSGGTIVLYRDSVPPPDAPAGLAATSGKGGLVTLTWYSVTRASSFNLYRRAENEATPTRIETGILGSPAQDTPTSDGTYYYSVTSIGLLQSESQLSSEVQGISDSTGPDAPVSLSLSLDGSGVTATWVAGTSETVKGYNAYRSGSAITSTSGLTPFAKVANTTAVDTAPVQSQRFYAVAAVDMLGNEGPISATKEIVFPVSPVTNLQLVKLDDAAPTISWQAPGDGNITGYYIYRNGSRITQSPVIDLSYTDAYYSGGTTTYGISAVDDLGNESPVKNVALYDINLGIKQGTTLRRGLLETAYLFIQNNSQTGFNIDSLSVQVGTAPESEIDGPFTLQGIATFQVEKVVATTMDASSTVAVLVSANWSPSPGVSVMITRTSSASVTGSGSAFEIFNDPLVRGTDAKVSIKVNNLGSARMDFLTSENSGLTKKVSVNLKDEDGNVLSTGYLNQQVGNTVVNTGAHSIARLNPGDSILTEPITLNVPMSAPYNIYIEAAIDNTYYDYGSTDQVTAPGMKQSTETAINETAYRATAAPEHAFYPNAQPVLITGQAIDNTTNNPAALVPVKLGISVSGFDRYYTVTTDANGNFSYIFNPGANEAGTYNVWAIHPDVKDRTVQSTFAIAGLSINPSYSTVRMVRGGTLDIPLTISNYGGGTLDGLNITTQSSPGITAQVINTNDNQLTAGENDSMTLRITASDTTPDTGYATLAVTTNEGLSVKHNASITIVSLIPVINTTPSYIDTGMVRGNQKIASFTISNTGQDVLRNAHIDGPATQWMTLTIDKAIGDINPGESKTVGVMFNPPDSIAEGVYNDKIVIYSDNYIAYTYNILVTVTSSAVGSVFFDVMNELMEKVPNATITFQYQTLPELMYTVKTDSDGTAAQYDIPEGRYTYILSPPPGHSGYSGSFVISPGLTTTVPIALEMKMVTVEWSVTPVTLEDRYDITIKQTFETNVPTPVLITEPAGLTLPQMQPGQIFNGEFTVTNYGLIQVDNVQLDFPTSFMDYDIEVMTSTVPKTIGAMQKVTVPYKITRRFASSLAGYSSGGSDCSTLFEEVRGYGGSSCFTSFNIVTKGTAVICPNMPQQRTVEKDTTHTVTAPIGCPSGLGGSSGGGGVKIAQPLGPMKDPDCINACIPRCGGGAVTCGYKAIYFPLCEAACVIATCGRGTLPCTAGCGLFTAYEIWTCWTDTNKCLEDCVKRCPDLPF